MQLTLPQRRRLMWRLGALLAAAVLLRGVLGALALQLGGGYLLMLPALPLCRLLERRLPPSPSATLALLAVGAAAMLAVLLLLPPLLSQLGLLTDALPGLLQQVQDMLDALQQYLQARGVDLTPVRDELFLRLGERTGALLSGAAQAVGRVFSAVSKLFLAPLLAFYLLRDRQRIAAWLTLLVPVPWRARAVRAAREMRREAVSFLRGQLLLSLSVGALTALGLMLTGVPGWLALGALMGVMELIPYLGPVLAGLPAVLLALQGGWSAALWALAVLLLVQQLEGAVLSPRLLSGATRLHPLPVLLALSAGGFLFGAAGMLLALPAVVSVRGALRGLRD